VVSQDDLAAADCQQAGRAHPQVAVSEPVTAADRFKDASGDVEPVQPAAVPASQAVRPETA
jgi:hypothetical protein